MKIGWVKFVLPFMFVLSPTLLMIGKPSAIVYDATTAFLGVYIATVGIVGYFQREIGPVLRITMIAAGVAAILPDSHIGFVMPGFISACGVLVGGGILAFEYVNRRRTALVSGVAE
jgi:TRAP-type uncharacterized transport system fused permease subunit